MKKLSVLFLILALLLTLAACGGEKAAPPTQEPTAEPEEPVNIPNPVREATAESILQDFGFSFPIPQGAEDIAYAVIDAEPAIAQMTFTRNGASYALRMAAGSEATDLSGMYYDWPNTVEAAVGYCPATLSWIDGEQGIAFWCDVAPGLLYSLSVDRDASRELLLTTANELFVPVQGDVDGDADASVDDNADGGADALAGGAAPTAGDESFAADFSEVLVRIHAHCFPGTAGSTLVGAAHAGELADLFTDRQPTAEQVRSATAQYITSLDEEGRALFTEQIGLVQNGFDDLMGEQGAELLDSCGYEKLSETWDADVLGELFAAMTAAVDSANA